jgi:hypothetical protein
MDAYKKEMEEYNKSIVAKLEQKTDEEWIDVLCVQICIEHLCFPLIF